MHSVAEQKAPDGASTFIPIRFWLDSVEDMEDESDFKVYKDVEMVTLKPDKNTSINKKVDDDIKRRFPAQYEAWVKTLDISEEGMDLKLWPLATPADIKTLHALGIKTVEDLATTDIDIPSFLKSKQERAVNWLSAYAENGKSVEELTRLKKDNETLKKQNERLQADNDKLNAALEKGKPKK